MQRAYWFEYHTNEVPDNWNHSSNYKGTIKSIVDAEKGRCAVFEGDMSQRLYIAQTANISGKTGDTFNLSCWVNGVGIPEKDSWW